MLLKAERDRAVSQSVSAAAAAAAAASATKAEQERASALRDEAIATASCALSAMQGLLQVVGEQAGRIEAKCSLIQQQPAITAVLLERITRCKRIAREDLPGAADRGISLRNQLSTLAESRHPSAGAPFSKMAAEYNAAVDMLKDDYTNIELEACLPLIRPCQARACACARPGASTAL